MRMFFLQQFKIISNFEVWNCHTIFSIFTRYLQIWNWNFQRQSMTFEKTVGIPFAMGMGYLLSIIELRSTSDITNFVSRGLSWKALWKRMGNIGARVFSINSNITKDSFPKPMAPSATCSATTSRVSLVLEFTPAKGLTHWILAIRRWSSCTPKLVTVWHITHQVASFGSLGSS